MPAANLVTKLIKSAYDEMGFTSPTMFLQSFFGKNPTELSLSESEKVEIDVIRDKNLLAVDVIRGGSDGNTNKITRFTTKEYSPPLYNEKTPITASMLTKRIAGRSPYDQISDRDFNLAAHSVRGQSKQTRKIIRSMESQASEVIFDGIITLINTDSLDYKRKATHNITPSVQWTTSAGDPIADLLAACQVNHQDGKMKPNMAIFGSTAWITFIQNTNVKNYLDNRRIRPGDVAPVNAPLNATFQGVIWVGDYQLELFTYPEFSEDSSGTVTLFVPEKQVAVMNGQARLEKAFAAVEILPDFENQYDEIGIVVPELIRGQFVPYSYLDPPSTRYVGVQSAPLLIPTAIDTISNINAIA